MSTVVKVEPHDFDNAEILDDVEIEQIGQEVNELIELLNDDDNEDDKEDDDSHSTATRYPGLVSKNTKRDHEESGMLLLFNFNTKLYVKS